MDTYINKSNKIINVRYDIRGILLQIANNLEQKGHKIIKLNIGNPALFGFKAPNEILEYVTKNLSNSEGYSDSKGLYLIRKSIADYYKVNYMVNIDAKNIYIGNGVSELIIYSMQALLNNGDEILIPSPDYPLWTASVTLSGGKAIHYLCDEQSEWFPNLKDIKKKITKKTKGIVIINPNNPTGSVYSKNIILSLIAIARKYNLIIFYDEIYEKIIFDNKKHYSIIKLAPDLITLTFNGLSKAYYLAGFRQGWMIINDPNKKAESYIEGLNTVTSMRLCANVPMQHAIKSALSVNYNQLNAFIKPGGRLYEQRNIACDMLNNIPNISCVKPYGALYIFLKFNLKHKNVLDDKKLVLDFLLQKHVLLTEGSAFNWKFNDHLRLVILPNINELKIALNKFKEFIRDYYQ